MADPENPTENDLQTVIPLVPSSEVDTAQPEVVAESPAPFASDETHVIAGKRIALVGRFGSMNHREATNVLQSYHAQVIEFTKRSAGRGDGGPDWVVIGAEEPPLSQSELLGSTTIHAAAQGEVEILHESELWHRIGLVDLESSVRRYHTPAMLADLLGVSVRVIRRWHRRGLITPVATVHKLPYFDYAEVATAKRLATWIAAGASATAIERRLVDLVEVLPNIRRPLDQLSILVEGKQVLLRQGDGLIEPGGQMRFDFDSLPQSTTEPLSESQPDEIIAFRHPDEPPMLRAISQTDSDELLLDAYEAEDRDDLETAIAIYHTVLARDGMRADICFQIGELLYRMNFLVAARERYYATIEVDPEFVEARASLGGVLAELGQNELAIAAFRGALKMHHDYADVHYSLAKTLDRVGKQEEAADHWQTCLTLAPDAAWGDEARERLGL
ncbi:MAG: tetratricopeptide repeat protein [Planctomycetota bacterium]